MEGMCVKFDVIGLDSPCVDLAVNVRCFPKPNGAERIQNLSWQGGGKVASGMVPALKPYEKTDLLLSAKDRFEEGKEYDLIVTLYSGKKVLSTFNMKKKVLE